MVGDIVADHRLFVGEQMHVALQAPAADRLLRAVAMDPREILQDDLARVRAAIEEDTRAVVREVVDDIDRGRAQSRVVPAAGNACRRGCGRR